MQLWFVYFTFGMYFIAVWSIIPYLIKPKWFGFTREYTTNSFEDPAALAWLSSNSYYYFLYSPT